jgi:competence protein ComEC
MWLGMLSAALGQLAWVPLEPLNRLCSLLVAYIAQVAHWLAAPGWASLPVTAPSPAAIAFIGAAMLTGGVLANRALGRRQQLGGRRHPRLLAHLVVPLALVAAALIVPVGPSSRAPAAPPPRGLTLTFLDVGQGEAILLDPEPGDPVLVDAGPAGSDLPAKLADRAVERLAAVVVTHTASDHVGGLSAVLERISADAVVHADADRALRALAGGAGAPTREVSTGATLRSGALTLDVLWPPQADRAGADGDPNHRSIVLLARWRRFDALLTGDGEAEAIPLDPGPLDVLKLAHHGSQDAGLPELIERTDPAVAVISVGAENPFGHPHPSTLGALADENVPVLRTDRDGDVEIRVSARGFAVTG